MARPSDMDTDPNTARITWEVVVKVAPDSPLTNAAGAALSARIAQRTGVTPISVTVEADGSVTAVMPDTGVPVDSWVAWVASALAAFGRAGVVTGLGNRARVA